MGKFRISIGKKYTDSMLESEPLVAKNVTSDDLLVMIKLFITYGNAKAAMVISEEES